MVLTKYKVWIFKTHKWVFQWNFFFLPLRTSSKRKRKETLCFLFTFLCFLRSWTKIPSKHNKFPFFLLWSLGRWEERCCYEQSAWTLLCRDCINKRSLPSPWRNDAVWAQKNIKTVFFPLWRGKREIYSERFLRSPMGVLEQATFLALRVSSSRN